MRIEKILNEAIKNDFDFELNQIQEMGSGFYDLRLKNHNLLIDLPLSIDSAGEIDTGCEYSVVCYNDLEALLYYPELFVILNQISSVDEIIQYKG